MMKLEVILKNIPVSTLILITLLVFLIMYFIVNNFYRIPELKDELRDKKDSFQDLGPCHSFNSGETCPSRCYYNTYDDICYDNNTPCNKFWGNSCPTDRCDSVVTGDSNSVCLERGEIPNCNMYDSAHCPTGDNNNGRCQLTTPDEWGYANCYDDNTPCNYFNEDNCPTGTNNNGRCKLATPDNYNYRQCYDDTTPCNYFSSESCPTGNEDNNRCKVTTSGSYNTCYDDNTPCNTFNTDTCPTGPEDNYKCIVENDEWGYSICKENNISGVQTSCEQLNEQQCNYREDCETEWNINGSSCRDKYCNDYYNESDCPGANGQPGKCQWINENCTHTVDAAEINMDPYNMNQNYIPMNTDPNTMYRYNTDPNNTDPNLMYQYNTDPNLMYPYNTDPNIQSTATLPAAGTPGASALNPATPVIDPAAAAAAGTPGAAALNPATPVIDPAAAAASGTPGAAATLPAATLPATTQPATTQPATTQPATTQPVSIQPVTTQPVTTVASTVTTIPQTQTGTITPVPSNTGTTTQGVVPDSSANQQVHSNVNETLKYISSMPIPSTPLYGVKTGNYKGLGNIFLPMMKINEGNRKDIVTRININNNPVFSEDQ